MALVFAVDMDFGLLFQLCRECPRVYHAALRSRDRGTVMVALRIPETDGLWAVREEFRDDK